MSKMVAENIQAAFTAEEAARRALWDTYRTPSIGEPMVRLLKKDGSPGLMVNRLDASWKLVEPEGSPQ